MSTLLNLGRNAARDALAADIGTLAIGDSGASESTSQSGLQGVEVYSDTTASGLTETKPSDGVVKYEDTIGLSEANGSSMAEMVLRAAAADARTRTTFPSFTKANDFEVRITAEIRVRNP